MESAFSTLGFVIFGLWISTYAIVVESHRVHVLSELSHLSTKSPPPSSTPRPSPSPSPRHTSRPAKHPPWPASRTGQPKSSPPPPPLTLPRPSSPRPPPPSPPHPSSAKRQSHQMKAGKVVGLLFLGMAGIMQIGVVGFLVFKRRQLLKTKDRYQTSS